ncbi:hypothetical protein HDU76_001751 [Blyttiomyces sp. JEL0837]|nr:hypothetical protein HDU76_001751 [Blyttiomyces sp. JEL0837]
MVNFGTSLIVGLASVAPGVATVQATEIIYLVKRMSSSHGFGPSFYDYEALVTPMHTRSTLTLNPQPFTATFGDGNYANFNLYHPENYPFAPAGTTTTMYKTFNCNIIDIGRTLWDCGPGGGSTCYATAQFYCLPA